MIKIYLGFLTLIGITITVFSQTAEITYLEANKAELQLNKSETFNFLDKNFYSNQLFLFGENHGCAQPHELDLILFKHLHKKENVRIYIAEVDHIKAMMLNNYMKDGNDEWLLKVFKSWKEEGAQWANQAHWNKYKELYLFYQTLSSKEKFNIVGIDVIQDYSLASNYFSILLKGKHSEITSLRKFVSFADTIQYKNRRLLAQLARDIEVEMQSDKRYLHELKENYTAFGLFIKSAGYVGAGMTRDSIMYRNYSNLIQANKLQNKKMYGFLGFFHTLQCKYESMPFAGYVRQNLPTIKMVSLQMLALNSTVLLPYNEQLRKMMPLAYVNELRRKNPDFPLSEQYIPYTLSNEDQMMKVDGIEDLKSLTKENTITLFKLDAANTPYSKSKKLAEVSGFQSLKMSSKDEVTTNAFQYVILFRNSKAALPLN